MRGPCYKVQAASQLERQRRQRLDLTIIILAAGQGVRMRSDLPKVLHPLAGRPMVRFVLDAARSLEPACLVAVVGHQADAVRSELGGAIQTVAQVPQQGTAHAVLQARPSAAGRASSVLVLFGDTPLVRTATLRALAEEHRSSDATLTLLSSQSAELPGSGWIVREPETGRIERVVEDGETSIGLRLQEVCAGIFCFRDDWLWPALGQLQPHPGGEYFLADLVELALRQGCRVDARPAEELDVAGVDTRVGLARAEAEVRRRVNERWMLAGVTLVDPATTYIEEGVEIGSDTTVWPETILQGKTRIGRRCAIGPGSVIRDSVIADECRVEVSVLEGATMDRGSDIGPFSHLRKGAHLGVGAHVGNFGELKNSFLGPGAKMGHFSYLGDATIGARANIAAGTITCNFDGERKHATVVGEDVFIGSDTMLVAPVTVGEGAKTGAGSVVTHDVPPHSVVYGVPARVHSAADKEPAEEK
jgi:bifunctional UDP-N-acetylglucosamine pyrophosphorylase/glucosamine-1-phosphate N-acetyltransferase